MNNFEALLRKHHLRITKPRQEVFTTLLRASEPLSLPEICAASRNIDRSSVYRSIHKLKDIGAVKVVYIGWKELYELADLFKPHHHHLRCSSCQNLYHLSDAKFEKAIDDLANAQGFSITSHHFEIEGVCKDCRHANRS